jgi:hypothetical protein
MAWAIGVRINDGNAKWNRRRSTAVRLARRDSDPRDLRYRLEAA